MFWYMPLQLNRWTISRPGPRRRRLSACSPAALSASRRASTVVFPPIPPKHRQSPVPVFGVIPVDLLAAGPLGSQRDVGIVLEKEAHAHKKRPFGAILGVLGSEWDGRETNPIVIAHAQAVEDEARAVRPCCSS